MRTALVKLSNDGDTWGEIRHIRKFLHMTHTTTTTTITTGNEWISQEKYNTNRNTHPNQPEHHAKTIAQIHIMFLYRENAPSASSPRPRNAILPLLLSTSQTVSALSSYPLLRQRALSQSASASAEQLNRRVSHSCRMRSTMG